jgi:hypothetical protein
MKEYAPQEFNGAKLLGVFDSGSEEWHEARSYSLGGSDIRYLHGFESMGVTFCTLGQEDRQD